MSVYLDPNHDCEDHKGTAVVHCGRCRRAFFPDDKTQLKFKTTRNRADLPTYCDACDEELERLWAETDDGPQGRLF